MHYFKHYLEKIPGFKTNFRNSFAGSGPVINDHVKSRQLNHTNEPERYLALNPDSCSTELELLALPNSCPSS